MSVEEIKLENFVGKIVIDQDPQNPRREWDNLGVMYCTHKRYDLGDTHELDFSECESFEDQEKVIRAEHGRDCIMLPIYMFDHGSQTIATTPFSCNFDSGRVGTIVISRDKVRSEYGVKRISSKLKTKIQSYLEGEVETYDQYIKGEVYGYEVVEIKKDEEGEEYEDDKDSCWGYYTMEHVKEEVNSVLKTNLDHYRRVVGGEQLEIDFKSHPEYQKAKAVVGGMMQMYLNEKEKRA